jgi:hypothetical protein
VAVPIHALEPPSMEIEPAVIGVSGDSLLLWPPAPLPRATKTGAMRLLTRAAVGVCCQTIFTIKQKCNQMPLRFAQYWGAGVPPSTEIYSPVEETRRFMLNRLRPPTPPATPPPLNTARRGLPADTRLLAGAPTRRRPHASLSFINDRVAGTDIPPTYESLFGRSSPNASTVSPPPAYASSVSAPPSYEPSIDTPSSYESSIDAPPSYASSIGLPPPHDSLVFFGWPHTGLTTDASATRAREWL